MPKSLRRYVHDHYREFEPTTPPELSVPQRDRLVRAVQKLEVASSADVDRAAVYRPLLARSLFCLGRFEAAAAAYQALIEDGVGFKDDVSGSEENYDWELWFHYALCHKLNGNSDRAVAALLEFSERKTRHVPEPLDKLLRPHGIAW